MAASYVRFKLQDRSEFETLSVTTGMFFERSPAGRLPVQDVRVGRCLRPASSGEHMLPVENIAAVFQLPTRLVLQAGKDARMLTRPTPGAGCRRAGCFLGNDWNQGMSSRRICIPDSADGSSCRWIRVRREPEVPLRRRASSAS